MTEFGVTFDKAWDNFNNEWFDNKLSEKNKNDTRLLIKS